MHTPQRAAPAAGPVIASLALALGACASGPAAYEGRGPYAVDTFESIVLPDPVQGRDVRFRVHVPRDARRMPVVVYSHGAGCGPEHYDRITRAWAERGYLVILPTHPDALPDLGGLAPDDYAGILSARIRDLSFALSVADTLAARDDAAARLEPGLAAVAGHSFGGMTAMIKFGLELEPGSFRFGPDPADGRFAAAVVMSGVGPLPPIRDGAFAALPGPLIATGGTLDIGQTGGPEVFPWEWRVSGYDLAPPGGKYRLVLEGGDHYLGGLICRADKGGEDDFEGVEILNQVTTAFLDAYVRRDVRARRWLERTDVPRLTGGRARWSIK